MATFGFGVGAGREPRASRRSRARVRTNGDMTLLDRTDQAAEAEAERAEDLRASMEADFQRRMTPAARDREITTPSQPVGVRAEALDDVVETSDGSAPAAAVPAGGRLPRDKVSGWRVFDRVLGGDTISSAIDSERARLTENAVADFVAGLVESPPGGPAPATAESAAAPGGDPAPRGAMGQVPTSLLGRPDLGRVLGTLMRASADGAQVKPYLDALQSMERRRAEDRYRSSLPEDAQARAELDLPGEIAAQREADKERLITGGGYVGSYRGGTLTDLRTPAPDPLSVDDQTAAALDKAQRQGIASLTPVEKRLIERHFTGPERSAQEQQNKAAIEYSILHKKARGEALTEGEQQIYDDVIRRPPQIDPYAMFGGAGGVDEDEPAAAPARTTARGGAAPAAASPPVNLLQEGQVTTFANGQAWTLQGGKAVRVK